MKRALNGVNAVRTAAWGAQSAPFTNIHKEIQVKNRKQPVVRRQPARKIADAQRVRFGNGMAPAKLGRSADAAIADSGAIRFGNGMAPASLRK